MDLHKCLLEDILRRVPTSGKTNQEVIKFLPVTLDQDAKCLLLAATVKLYDLLITEVIQRLLAIQVHVVKYLTKRARFFRGPRS